MAHVSHAKTLPANLGAPPVVDVWKSRALLAGVIFSVVAVSLKKKNHYIHHVLRT